ncbi:hypothetical protein KP509_26G065200 [Ceratopteris richardii]|uniref:Uncharacterized protein n=1 Tax=Ceratopteris richardii TaxID=49495 RepID=A0A8T2RP09_CERRI|nr:hypothetical protein KP509_26G065200 [Ceratopteris richardii]
MLLVKYSMFLHLWYLTIIVFELRGTLVPCFHKFFAINPLDGGIAVLEQPPMNVGNSHNALLAGLSVLAKVSYPSTSLLKHIADDLKCSDVSYPSTSLLKHIYVPKCSDDAYLLKHIDDIPKCSDDALLAVLSVLAKVSYPSTFLLKHIADVLKCLDDDYV